MQTGQGVKIAAAVAIVVAGVVGLVWFMKPPRPACELPAWNVPADPPLPKKRDQFNPESVAMFEQLAGQVHAAPGDPELWLQLGMAYHAHGEFELAQQCYQASLTRRCDQARAWYDLALVNESLAQHADAIAAMNRAIHTDPEQVAPHWRLALMLLDQGDVSAAEKAAREAVQLDSSDRLAATSLAKILIQSGNNKEAALVLQQTVARYPGDKYVHFLLGTVLRNLGRETEAAPELAQGQGAEPEWTSDWEQELQQYHVGFRARFNSALAILNSPESAGAIPLFEDLRREQPENVDVLINLSIAYRKSLRVDEAIGVLNEAVRLRPELDLAHFHLAGAYRQQSAQSAGEARAKLLEQALEHARKAIAVSPTFAEAQAIAGEIVVQLGRFEEAIPYLQEAIRLDSANPQWRLSLGMVLCRIEKWDSAEQVLTDGLLLAPNEYQIMYFLAMAQANSGRLDAAEATINRALTIRPGDKTFLQMLDMVNATRANPHGESPSPDAPPPQERP